MKDRNERKTKVERGVIERRDETSLENVGEAVEIRSDGGDRTRWERETAVTALSEN